MNEPLAHYVSTAPFDPLEAEALAPEQERVYFASQCAHLYTCIGENYKF